MLLCRLRIQTWDSVLNASIRKIARMKNCMCQRIDTRISVEEMRTYTRTRWASLHYYKGTYSPLLQRDKVIFIYSFPGKWTRVRAPRNGFDVRDGVGGDVVVSFRVVNEKPRSPNLFRFVSYFSFVPTRTQQQQQQQQ